MTANVFSREAFRERATNHFELVTVDFPRDKSGQSDEVQRQNAELLQRYPVAGYPTIYLLDSEARPYARSVGYGGQDVEGYLALLESQRKIRLDRDEAFARAAELEGVERARELNRGISLLDRSFVFPHYASVVEEILELDPDNGAKLREVWEGPFTQHVLAVGEVEIREALEGHGAAGEWDELVVRATELLETYGKYPELAQLAYFTRAVAYLESGRTESGVADLKRAHAEVATSELAKTIESFLADLDRT